MKKQKYRYVSRRKSIKPNRIMVVALSAVMIALVIVASIFIGDKLIPVAPGEQGISSSDETPTPSETSESPDKTEPSEQATPEPTPSPEVTPEPTEEPVSQGSIPTPEPDAPAYQSKYPDLYVTDRPKMHVLENNSKVVYLTFDDGPSDLTAPLLDVLKKYDAKATFFDCCQSDYQDQYSSLMKRCVDEGHTVAVHTYSHVMKDVYASVDSFLDDFYKMYTHIEKVTGQKPANFFRFPGGSRNGYNQAVYKDIIKEMTRRGFIYYDWDGDSGDASGNNVSGATIYQNTMNAIHNDCNVILMHNIFGKQSTLDQVGKIIETAQAEGYVFKAMDGTLDPTHGYLMTNREFISAALESDLIQLSDWRMEREGLS